MRLTPGRRWLYHIIWNIQGECAAVMVRGADPHLRWAMLLDIFAHSFQLFNWGQQRFKNATARFPNWVGDHSPLPQIRSGPSAAMVEKRQIHRPLRTNVAPGRRCQVPSPRAGCRSGREDCDEIVHGRARRKGAGYVRIEEGDERLSGQLGVINNCVPLRSGKKSAYLQSNLQSKAEVTIGSRSWSGPGGRVQSPHWNAISAEVLRGTGGQGVRNR